jgi:hypothetical protein
MSDFGAILILKKASGNFTAQDKELIVEKLSSIIEAGDYLDIIKKGNYKSLIDWEDDTALCSMLTEYFDDENSEEVRAFAKEDDIEDVEDIAQKLQSKLGNSFTVVSAFEDW